MPSVRSARRHPGCRSAGVRQPATGKKADFCPSLWGGKDWPPVAYSPKTRLLYIPANDNLCGTMVGEKKPLVEGQLWLGADVDKLDLSKSQQQST